MQKTFKFLFKILKFLSYAFVGICLLCLLFFLYLQYSFKQKFTEERISQIVSEIKEKNPLPEEFIRIYEQTHTTTNLKEFLINSIKEKYQYDCPCYNIAIPLSLSNQRINITRFFLTHQLEKHLSQEECLAYHASKFDFTFGNKGIENASQFYFSKNLDELETIEMQTLVLMFKNPILYNPKRNPKILKKKLQDSILSD